MREKRILPFQGSCKDELAFEQIFINFKIWRVQIKEAHSQQKRLHVHLLTTLREKNRGTKSRNFSNSQKC